MNNLQSLHHCKYNISVQVNTTVSVMFLCTVQVHDVWAKTVLMLQAGKDGTLSQTGCVVLTKTQHGFDTGMGVHASSYNGDTKLPTLSYNGDTKLPTYLSQEHLSHVAVCCALVHQPHP